MFGGVINYFILCKIVYHIHLLSFFSLLIFIIKFKFYIIRNRKYILNKSFKYSNNIFKYFY